ncbi:MAG: hypothetical protein AAFY56_22320 [Pseudomonadota bacterium]
MSNNRKSESDIVAGLGISSRDMAELIVDALIDANLVAQDNREGCVDIAAEEIWVRKLLVDNSRE